MTEARWKLVMDEQGVTIASDRFQFTTNGSGAAQSALDDPTYEPVESSQLEGMVSELQTMTKRTYGQFCGLSRALEIVGERWTLLIVRDLLVSPKSITELQRGLPRIPTDVLCSRLNELEHTGVIRRTREPRADGTAVYELTSWGTELDDIALRLGLWGTRLLGEPRPEDIVTVDSMVMALRTTFQPAAARGLSASYELRLGDIVLHATIDDGKLVSGSGPLPGADLIIEPGRALKDLMSGELSPEVAIAEAAVHVHGDPALLSRFVECFRIPPSPDAS